VTGTAGFAQMRTIRCSVGGSRPSAAKP